MKSPGTSFFSDRLDAVPQIVHPLRPDHRVGEVGPIPPLAAQDLRRDVLRLRDDSLDHPPDLDLGRQRTRLLAVACVPQRHRQRRLQQVDVGVAQLGGLGARERFKGIHARNATAPLTPGYPTLVDARAAPGCAHRTGACSDPPRCAQVVDGRPDAQRASQRDGVCQPPRPARACRRRARKQRPPLRAGRRRRRHPAPPEHLIDLGELTEVGESREQEPVGHQRPREHPRLPQRVSPVQPVDHVARDYAAEGRMQSRVAIRHADGLKVPWLLDRNSRGRFALRQRIREHRLWMLVERAHHGRQPARLPEVMVASPSEELGAGIALCRPSECMPPVADHAKAHGIPFDRQPRVARSEVRRDRERRVLGRVVDDDDSETRLGLVEQRLERRPDMRLAVERRHADDGARVHAAGGVRRPMTCLYSRSSPPPRRSTRPIRSRADGATSIRL